MLERLGETAEFGDVVGQLIERAGWTLQPPRPAIGGGHLFFATRFALDEEYEVKRIGERFSDVAAQLLEDALMFLPPERPLVDVQLRLPFAA